MDLSDTPDQAELRSVVRGFAQRHAAPEHVRAVMAGPDGHDPVTWRRLSAELGLAGLAVPEAFGGAGAGPGEVAVVVEEFGRVLLPSPYLSTAVAALTLAGAAAACPEAARRYLPGLADGSVIGALALDADVTVTNETGPNETVTGVARHVVDGPAAGLLLVRARGELFAVAASDAAAQPLETLDQTRRQAAVRFDRAPALPAGPAASAVALQRVLLAAECAAAAEHCLEVTVAYLMSRRQFGRPLGAFQALKHRVADLKVAVTSAQATARAAVLASASDPISLPPLAALHCSRTFVQVAGEMIQLHGGIGFTWEHEAHLYFKRAKSTQLLLGPVSGLRTEIGRAAGLLPA
jgi:alkylation response protein AidB-like acyl-CoA dehydrogenase